MVKLYETGVYQITCKINKRMYIGGVYVPSFERRWKEHLDLLRERKHHNRHLQNSFRKYKESQFVFEIIERCKPGKVLENEQFWLNWLWEQPKRLRFNINPIAGLFAPGRNRVEEIAESIRQKAIENWENEKYKLRHSKAMKRWFDEEIEGETRRERQIRRNKSRENRLKVSATLMGHEVSEEVKQTLKEAALKQWSDPEQREKAITSRWDEESKRKQSEYKKEYWRKRKEQEALERLSD